MRDLIATTTLALLLAAGPALAINPGTDVFVPAAARGAGATGTWVTDVFVYNPGTTSTAVSLYWLPRDTDNTGAAPVSFTVAPGQTLALEDVISTVFGLSSGAGAIRVTAGSTVVVTSRIYNTGGATGTFGQGFEGVPASAAITAGGSTDIVGLAQNASFTTNLFAVNTGTTQATVTFELRDAGGATLASRSYQLPPLAAFYRKITDLGGPNFDRGTVHATVTQGSAIVVGSTIDIASGDPTTMAAWWSGGGAAGLVDQGTYFGVVDDGTGGLGGMRMVVDASAQVTSLEFYFPSADAGCPFFFPATVLFDPAVPLADFSLGVPLTADYDTDGDGLFDDGTVSFTVTLTVQSPGLHLSGTIEAVGSGWSGADAACNVTFPSDDVFLGKLQPGS
ncbi:MAG: hypothetical protein D6739_01845 [Nitrospirae bacterium]|nr:MAG: hypothetical protein D6739_01845 [Nitrospirota bacterium]